MSPAFAKGGDNKDHFVQHLSVCPVVTLLVSHFSGISHTLLPKLLQVTYVFLEHSSFFTH